MNEEESVDNFDSSVSKKATQRVLKLIVDFLKIGFQAFLVVFVLTQFITGRLNIVTLVIGIALCLTSLVIAFIIEVRREGE